MDWFFGLALVLIAFVAAVAGLLVVNALQTPPKRQTVSVFSDIAHPDDGGSGTVYLFDGEVLVDATPGARQILATSRGRGSNWLRLIGYLTLYIPDVETELRRLDEEGQILIEGQGVDAAFQARLAAWLRDQG